MIKLSLKSDFRDYYDVWFDREDETNNIFERYSNSGMNRLEMFQYLSWKKLDVVKNGYVYELYEENKVLNNIEKVVVYHDINAHRSEGKELMTLEDAYEKYPDSLCSKYIQSFGTSYRWLQIGMWGFFLKYKNQDDWRNNVGNNVDIKLLSMDIRDKYDKRYIKHPLYAVDFVLDKNAFWAIDFNIAPRVKGTGVEKILSGRQVVETIKDWYRSNIDE